MRRKKRRSMRSRGGNSPKPNFLKRMFMKLKSPAGMALGVTLIATGAVLAKKNDKISEMADKIVEKIDKKG